MVSKAMVLTLALTGCTTVGKVNDLVVDNIKSANAVAYQTAEMIMCDGITIGEWMRSIAPYPEKVEGWRALCVGTELPNTPVKN